MCRDFSCRWNGCRGREGKGGLCGAQPSLLIFSIGHCSGSELDVDLRKVIYYHGIENTGIKEWQKLFEIHQCSTVASERRQLLHGLSASKEPTILLKYVQDTITCFF
jgi:hypothetical protein